MSDLQLQAARPEDAGFIGGQASRLAAASRLPWLLWPATDQFAAAGCQQAAAIGQPGQLVLIAVDPGCQRLGFVHATARTVYGQLGYAEQSLKLAKKL
jgi:hypothetical protein